ncbi:MAG: UvrD-helicase domain-containing protein, partial [Actinobacteria bacterium]|nr:UvrD-helicase domain-containing protein [Actinomycetota bacterium]
MVLRWDADQPETVEQYRRRYPDLDANTLVALLYEEFCLREEAGAAPDPADYERRFPELAAQLRRVFDIHALVGGPDAPTMGSLGSTLSTAGQARTQGIGLSAADRSEFPEAGETIGGFRLVEELGRGSFARVYLAHERLLAESGTLDFGDLVLQAFRLLREKPHVRARLSARYRHVLVDDLQDTSFAQGLLLRLLVAEHGDYPKSPTGNTQYPKRRLFEEIVKVFEKTGKVVPVFIDKHISDNWDDMKWIYDKAKELDIPI